MERPEGEPQEYQPGSRRVTDEMLARENARRRRQMTPRQTKIAFFETLVAGMDRDEFLRLCSLGH